MSGLGMIWNTYEVFWVLGLTNRESDDILRPKTTTPPYISDTFSDTLGHTHSIVNNSLTHIV